MSSNRVVSFLLSAPPSIPVGGFKVVFEYANRLADDGFIVNLVYPCYVYKASLGRLINVKLFIVGLLKFFIFYTFSKFYKVKWFKLHSGIREKIVFSLKESFVPRSDFYIATAVETAIELNKYTNNGQKLYLVQGYEDWFFSKEVLIDTYRYKMKTIVVSSWLYSIVSKYNENCICIPNGFDFNFFSTFIKPESRDRFRVLMMYHKDLNKGCNDGFKAFQYVKDLYPQLRVCLFGVPDRPKNLPDWYEYFQTPEKELFNRLYNESAIFVGPSWSEGWGLTIGESMMCSCAVVCTDNDGYKEMAKNNETALISPIKDPDSLANNIIRLIDDDVLRIRLAKNGNNFIKDFSWEKSYNRFKQFLLV